MPTSKRVFGRPSRLLSMFVFAQPDILANIHSAVFFSEQYFSRCSLGKSLLLCQGHGVTPRHPGRLGAQLWAYAGQTLPRCLQKCLAVERINQNGVDRRSKNAGRTAMALSFRLVSGHGSNAQHGDRQRFGQARSFGVGFEVLRGSGTSALHDH